MELTLNILIQDLNEILFNGTAKALTTFNEKGTLDILPLHENFISMITKNITLHLEDGKTQSFTITTGILKNYHNSIQIYLGVDSLTS